MIKKEEIVQVLKGLGADRYSDGYVISIDQVDINVWYKMDEDREGLWVEYIFEDCAERRIDLFECLRPIDIVNKISRVVFEYGKEVGIAEHKAVIRDMLGLDR